jgi:heme exporter protein A
MVKQQIFFPSIGYADDQQLVATALGCSRGGRQVFQDLDLTLRAGESLAVYGANGAGKTSLLRMLAGLLMPQTGGLALTHGSVALQCHYLGHADGLKANLTVAETVQFTAAFFAAPTGRLQLDDLGLAGREGQRTGDLSAGLKRRLMLARLILAPRKIWLLDEPLTALDTQGRALIEALARQHVSHGGMILAASHEPLDFATRSLTLSSPDIAPDMDGGAL